MKLGESNTWLIASLLFTTVLGPIVAWNFQEGRYEKDKARIAENMLQLEKNKQLVSLYERLNILLKEYRVREDVSVKLYLSDDENKKSKRQALTDEFRERAQEIERIRKIISELDGTSNVEVSRIKNVPMPLRTHRFE